MAWYRTGTVTVNNNSATVTGVGTLFVDNGTLNPGDIFFAPDAKDYEIASIQSNTQFTLVTPYLGANAAGASYAIAPIGLLPSALALQVKSTLALASQASAAAILSTPAQGLTTVQQANARANIASVSAADVVSMLVNGSITINGTVTLNGMNGVTITHNKGNINYLLKIMPNGSNPGDVGEISYVKAANTVTVYNSGLPRIPADYELSITA